MQTNNKMNFFNPLMNQNFNYAQYQQMLQQQMMQFQQAMQQQDMMMRQQMENMQKEQNQISSITVGFRGSRDESPTWVQCKKKERVADIIEKYRNLSKNSNSTIEFIFNAKLLSPVLTIEEAGLINNSIIFVVETKGIRGG